MPMMLTRKDLKLFKRETSKHRPGKPKTKAHLARREAIKQHLAELARIEPSVSKAATLYYASISTDRFISATISRYKITETLSA